jgi:hypothetical protein
MEYMIVEIIGAESVIKPRNEPEIDRIQNAKV